MKKITILFILQLLAVVSLQAQPRYATIALQPVGPKACADASAMAVSPASVQGLSSLQRVLGYTLTDDIDADSVAFGKAGTYSVGAVVTPDMLADYAGCKVVGIRLAAAVDLGRTRTFVYNFTGSSLESLYAQNQRVYKGWNSVFFNGSNYEIKGDETLFFGYDYVETADMVAADFGGMSCVGADTDGAFYLYGDYGKGVDLYNITGAGMLCVQLIVDVSTLPRHDLSVSYLDTGFKYKQPGDTIEVLSMFTNVGLDTIRQCKVGYQLDQMEPVTATLHDVVAGGSRATWQFDVVLPVDLPVGLHSLKVFASEVEGETIDQSKPNRVDSAQFAVYRESVQRSKSYLEVYTDQNSLYVPFLNDAIDMMLQYNKVACVVNVHRPNTPLALDAAAYLHELYAYTWPTFTVNRAYFPGEAYVAYDMNEYLPVFPADMAAGILSDIVTQDYYSPSFASIQLKASYDAATRQLVVDTEGELLPEAEAFYGDVALTLLLTEDGVKSRQMEYNARTQGVLNTPNYVHDHVLRAYLTAPTGDVLTASNGHYAARHTLTVDGSWQADKLQVVGLLTKKVDKVTTANMRDVDVINAASADLGTAVGIAPVQTTTAAGRSAYYTLHGRRAAVGNAAHGLYLERCPDGTVRKVMR